MNAYMFLNLLAKGLLPSTESIRRTRQKLQEEMPELRGDKYLARHKEQENVQKELYESPEFYAGGTP